MKLLNLSNPFYVTKVKFKNRNLSDTIKFRSALKKDGYRHIIEYYSCRELLVSLLKFVSNHINKKHNPKITVAVNMHRKTVKKAVSILLDYYFPTIKYEFDSNIITFNLELSQLNPIAISGITGVVKHCMLIPDFELKKLLKNPFKLITCHSKVFSKNAVNLLEWMRQKNIFVEDFIGFTKAMMANGINTSSIRIIMFRNGLYYHPYKVGKKMKLLWNN